MDMNYETPLWSIIGALIGFVFSFVFIKYMQGIEYRKKTQQVTERLKAHLHLQNPEQTKYRIADLIYQFEEKEQIKILVEIGMESSLNSFSDDVTEYVIRLLRWISVLYEVESDDYHGFITKSLKDLEKVKSIRNGLEEIAVNVVEYLQSESLFNLTLSD